jgi:hypothetical protein
MTAEVAGRESLIIGAERDTLDRAAFGQHSDPLPGRHVPHADMIPGVAGRESLTVRAECDTVNEGAFGQDNLLRMLEGPVHGFSARKFALANDSRQLPS